MSTVAVPSSTRDEAEATIAAQIGRGFSPKTRLEALGTVAAVQLLLALELRFDILLDVDEVLPDGTLGGLVGLVMQRAAEAAPRRERPSNLIDLAQRRAERARRAQAELEIPAPPAQPAAPARAALEPVTLPPEPVDFPRRTLRRLFAACAFGGAFAALVVFTLPHA